METKTSKTQNWSFLKSAKLFLLVFILIVTLINEADGIYCAIGTSYAEGKYFFPQNYKKAVEWFNKSIEKDEVEGYYELAKMYIDKSINTIDI